MRIGIIVPSSNFTVEDEIFQIFKTIDSTMSFHFVRIDYKTRFKDSFEDFSREICNEIPKAVKMLKKIPDMDKIFFFCTTASLFLEEFENVSMINPIESLRNLIFETDIKQPTIISPYSEQITNFVLNKIGLKRIENTISLNKLTSREIYKIDEIDILNILEKKIETSDSCIALCTNFPTLNLFKKIENKNNLLLISSNLSLFSQMFNIPIQKLYQ